MTDKQKEFIRTMRFQGFGYSAISKAMNLKENRVQAYCKKHGLAGSAELTRLNYPIWCEQNNRCLVCGTKLKQPKTGRRKRFCSGRCRTRFCREKKEDTDNDADREIHS